MNQNKLLSNLNTPWCASILIALLYLIVLTLQLSAHDRDPSYFIGIGDTYVMQASHVPNSLRVIPDSLGYDGQFYYQLALNPFGTHWVNDGLMLDLGAYRHQRIFYPLLVWLFSFGNRDLIPGMLLLINYLSLCALAWLGTRYVQVHGHHALWGCLFALYPGFLFSLTRDTTEILSSVFLLAGLLSIEQNSSNAQTAVLLSMAVLTRETTLITALALGIALAIGRDYRSWLTVALPLGVYVIWQINLWMIWDTFPISTAGLVLGIPVHGIWNFIKSLDWYNSFERIWLIEIAYLTVVTTGAIVAANSTKSRLAHKLMWILCGALVISMTQNVWIEDVAFMRASTEFYFYSLILILISTKFRLIFPVTLGTAAIWLLVSIRCLNW